MKQQPLGERATGGCGEDVGLGDTHAPAAGTRALAFPAEAGASDL